jgi:hypothetical protein
MAADLQYLRQHYASLSDQALLEIKRADLVEAAQKLYDDEVARRKLTSRTARPSRPADESVEAEEELSGDGDEQDWSGDEPDWMDDGSEVLSRPAQTGSAPADAMVDAQNVLEAAGIPSYLDLSEIPETDPASARPTHLWRLLVPFHLNLHAASVLDRDIFNQDFEAAWRTNLEALSDEELLATKPEVAFCGLFDRVERATRAYDEELARRKL